MSWYIIFFQVPLVPERVVHRLVAKLWRDWSPSYRESEDVFNALAALPEIRHRAAALSYYRSMARNSTPAPAHSRLHQYRNQLPCNRFLYLHGSEDGALNPDFVDVLADALAGNAEVKIVHGAGHFLQIEQPQTVAAEILQFVERSDPDVNANNRQTN
jgi:pimeloyl-ACP methyl ester carboxylesterase